MARYAAFLRAVNLGGDPQGARARSWSRPSRRPGFEDVATFRTSGNVAFSAPGRTAKAKLVEAIEAGSADELGFEVPVFVRTEPELEAIAAERPFAAKAVEASKGKLQVALLLEKPPAAAKKRDDVAGERAGPARAEGHRALLAARAAAPSSRALDMKAIDRAVGLNTLRTQGTIEQMAAKFF